MKKKDGEIYYRNESFFDGRFLSELMTTLAHIEKNFYLAISPSREEPCNKYPLDS